MGSDSGTSIGVGGLVRPAIKAATKTAQADNIKKVKMSVKVKIAKKKV
jgi:hypothetical protein